MIRRILLASVGAMTLAGTAVAADLTPSPPPPPPPMWSGFYIGLNAGGTWSNSNTVNTATADLFGNPALVGGPAFGVASAALATASVPVSSAGFIGGGQIGYNYQFANSWLVGIEADLDGIASSHSRNTLFSSVTIPAFPANLINQSLSSSRFLDYLGTVRGRVGYLITPTFLVYGTGGLAYGGMNSSTGIVQTVEGPSPVPFSYGSFGSISNTRVGWTAGGGAEWMFMPNWSVKVEYLYYDLGSVAYSQSELANYNTAGTLFTLGAPLSRVSFRGNVVRAGINYRFNWGAPAPVVAKY
ncbi:MAG TPA: outer membrane beta-barrel protein [Methylocella sp.]|nr:outer membrane beta-barrel protein [Methylocella sp.]